MLNRRQKPSFLPFYTSSPRRDSITLPDYYRETRLEQYGPYYRSSETAQSLMNTPNLQGRESPDSICALPDILEEDELELELDDTTFEIFTKFHHKLQDTLLDDNVVEQEKRPKRFLWLWRVSSSVIRKCYGLRAAAVKSTGRDAHFHLSA